MRRKARRLPVVLLGVALALVAALGATRTAYAVDYEL